MDKKVLDFQKMSVNLDMPVDREVLLKNIQNNIPEDIIQEYIAVIEMEIEKTLQWKNILTAKNKPNQCRFLIENLEQDQLVRLNKIVMLLSDKNPFENTAEIAEITFGFSKQESISKSQTMISHLKSFDIDYGQESEKLATLSRHMQLLSRILSLLNLGGKEFEGFDGLLTNKLASQSGQSLDELSAIINTLGLKK